MITDNKDEVFKQLDLLEKNISKLLLRAGLRIEAAVKEQITKEGLIDTGRFRASIHTEQPNPYTIIISDGVFYGIYHEIGTGLYGPKAKYIRPVRAKYLRFRPKGEYRYIFTKKVRGIKPKKPFLKALQNIQSILQQELERFK